MRFSRARRRVLVAGAASVAGCSGILPMGESGPTVEAPHYRAGDRWVYLARDGFMQPVTWQETHEIVAADAGGITVRVTQRGANVDSVRTEQWVGPGLVKVGALFNDETRRFERVLKRYDFPLAKGKTWTQWLRNYNDQSGRTGEVSRHVSVGGWRKIATPAGTYDALGMYAYIRLDDQEFWREATRCVYLSWYAPAVRAFVREEKEAEYWEKSGKQDTPPVRNQSAVIELVAYAPAPA